MATTLPELESAAAIPTSTPSRAPQSCRAWLGWNRADAEWAVHCARFIYYKSA